MSSQKNQLSTIENARPKQDELAVLPNVKFAEQLRQIADFYESHPGVPLPNFAKYESFSIDTFLSDDPEIARQELRAFGDFKKRFNDDWFHARKIIAGIAIELVSPRQMVCTRRVIGTKLVPAEVKPEHVEEIVEWDCEPILSGGAA